MKQSLVAVLLVLMLVVQPVQAAEVSELRISLLGDIINKIQSIIDTLGDKIAATSRESQLAAVATPGTGVGQRAQLKTTLSTYPVRRSANMSAETLGSQPKNAIGTITYGPTKQTKITYPVGCDQWIPAVVCAPTYTYYYWMQVNFDNGVDGWVEQKYLTPAASIKFTYDSTLITKNETIIRSAPNGTSKGTQPSNSAGVIIGSPIKTGGTVWWQVNYASGVDGWTDELAIKNAGIELPGSNLSVITLPSPIPTDPIQLQNLAADIGLSNEQLTGMLYDIKASDFELLSSGQIQIFQVKNSAAAATGLPEGTIIMMGQDDLGNFEVAVDTTDLGISIRENKYDDITQTWTVVDRVNDMEGVFVLTVVDVGYDEYYITMSQQNQNGDLDIMMVSEPFGQIDLSNVVWKMPDFGCDNSNCTDMTEWGVTANYDDEDGDGEYDESESVNITSGLGTSDTFLPPPWEQWCSINECPVGGKDGYNAVFGHIARVSFDLMETYGY